VNVEPGVVQILSLKIVRIWEGLCTIRFNTLHQNGSGIIIFHMIFTKFRILKQTSMKLPCGKTHKLSNHCKHDFCFKAPSLLPVALLQHLTRRDPQSLALAPTASPEQRWGAQLLV